MDEKMKKIFEPSGKIQKMYEAVAALVEEKRDLSNVKVSEITSRAGIGKGTAYEYFSSKEELIVYATMWLCGQQMKSYIEGIVKCDSFREKFFFLLEKVRENRECNALTLKAIKGSFQGDCEKMKSCIPTDVLEQVRESMISLINQLLELGYREHIFTEQNIEKRVLIFFGIMQQYSFACMNREEGFPLEMNEEELKAFAYDCMVKALN